MSAGEVYRGYKVPYPEKDGNIWYVADPEVGWFQSATKSHVVLFWKHRVETMQIQRARELGLLTHHGDAEICSRCGVSPVDVLLHIDWHEELDKSQ